MQYNRSLMVKMCMLLLCSFVVCFSIKNSCASNSLKSSCSVPQKVFFFNDLVHSDDFPFSFSYGGLSSVSLLSEVTPTVKMLQKDNNVQQIEKVWRCSDGLVVTFCAKYYRDYSASEWITYLSYEGKGKSKVISNLYGIDNLIPIQDKDGLIIHTNKGDDCTKQSYEPYDIILNRGQKEVFFPTQGGDVPCGKSTTGPRGWPYWNIQNGNQGWILAVGWPGTWQNSICRSDDKSFRVRAGQKTFRAVLRTGETVRTPLICVLPWKAADVQTAQNHWRHFYLDHVIPRFDGEPEKPATEIQAYMNEASIEHAKKYIKAGIKPRICWKDAGWYPSNTGKWEETGEWKIDPQKYPNGIKPYTKWAKGQGMECLLWFEPERVRGENMLTKNHQDWLLSIPNYKTKYLDLGNPEALNWLTNHISMMITDNGLEWYREDLNYSGPYAAWVNRDSEQGKNRQGITENMYVQGHLAFWDTLKQRHPYLHIDACASGGRRNDLETMHRAVPLLRSDYQWAKFGDEYIAGNQAHTWALSAWFPYQGSAVYEYEPYKFRSFYLPCFGMGGMKDSNAAAIIQAYTECKIIQPMMLYGDYWPLTPYSLKSDEWIAWQFNRGNEGDGCVQAFRREDCDNNHITIKLRGLDVKANYIIKSFDDPRVIEVSGRKLMRTGLSIKIEEKPGSAILIYEKLKNK